MKRSCCGMAYLYKISVPVGRERKFKFLNFNTANGTLVVKQILSVLVVLCPAGFKETISQDCTVSILSFLAFSSAVVS